MVRAQEEEQNKATLVSGFFVFNMAHTVYILHSKKLNRYYIGETPNIEERLVFHENSPAHKFTAKAKDWLLFHSMECSDKFQAKRIETHIKKMKSKVYIENLKKYPEIFDRLCLMYK